MQTMEKQRCLPPFSQTACRSLLVVDINQSITFNFYSLLKLMA